MLYDNTTVKGSWTNIPENNMTVLSKEYNRTVNNVTMAMPHASLFAAAQDPINGIVQPKELNVRLSTCRPGLPFGHSTTDLLSL